jgi:hypothetical protein
MSDDTLRYDPLPVEQLHPGDEIRFEIPYVPPPAQDVLPPGQGTMIVYDRIRSIQVRSDEYWLFCSEHVVLVYRRGERLSARVK